MPVLEGIKCPVCKNEFTDGDDVVYCPDCGTPHHRECYKMAGHCVNAGLHQSGFVFDGSGAVKKDAAPVQSNPVNTNAEGFYIPRQDSGAKSGEAPANTVPAMQMPDLFKQYEGDTIDGEDAKFYAATVKTNTKRFIGVFKKFEGKKSKLGWNWGAFFFGPYYLLFRKMYSQGIGFLVIQTLISYLGSFFLSAKAPKFVEATESIVAAKTGGTFSSMGFTQADLAAMQKAADYQTAINILMITFAALVVIRIITALVADGMYFSMVKNMIKNISKRLEGGEVIPMVTFGNAPAELTGDKAKMFFLARIGGTSLFPALIGYLAISILSTL